MDADNLLRRYEAVVRDGAPDYFEEEDYEEIIDYYVDMEKFEEATDAAARGCDIYPFSGELKLRLADLYIVAGRIEEATTLLHLLEYGDVARMDVALLKARVLMHTGQVKEAQSWFEQAIQYSENKEDMVECLLVAAEDCMDYEAFEPAISYFLRAKAIWPSDAELLSDLAYCYERMDDLCNSIACYEEYLDLHPFDDRVWYNVGTLYGLSENAEKALEAFDYALILNPHHTSALYNRSTLLFSLARYADAETSFRSFLEMEPDDLFALCSLGLCCLQQEKQEDAVTALEQALRLSPADEWCLAKLKELTSK